MKIKYWTIDDEEFEAKLSKRELNGLCDKLPELTKLVKEFRGLVKDCRAWYREMSERKEK